MDLSELVERTAVTDMIEDDDEAIRIGLFGIAGEAGSVVSEAKKYFRDGGPLPGFKSRVSEELGDLLWYVAHVCRRLRIDLNEVVEANLEKTSGRWTLDLPDLPAYDNHPHEMQKLLRQFIVRFEEDRSGDIPKVRMIPEGPLYERADREWRRKDKEGTPYLGDPIDDNSSVDDGYRYHDVIHLGHATVLGWSPVVRSFMGAKRRDVDDCDRVQDGARAMAIEEGLAATVFNCFEQHDFVSDSFDWDLFRNVRRTVRGLEVLSQPFAAWQSAYAQAFEIFTKLHGQRGGRVKCDLDARRLTLVE